MSLVHPHLVGQQDEPHGGREDVGDKQIHVDGVAEAAQVPVEAAGEEGHKEGGLVTYPGVPPT